MLNKTILRILLVPAVILLLPLFAMRFSDEVVWSVADFEVAWLLMTSAGLAYYLTTRRASSVAYRVAVGLAVGTAFVVIWGNLAVGFIGDESHPANRLYAGVLAIGILGTVMSRLKPLGMARTLWATALAQAVVPAVAMGIWGAHVTAEFARVCFVNTCVAALFGGSAWLFWRAAKGARDNVGASL